MIKYAKNVVAIRSKDPNEIVARTITWDDFLVEGETINTSTWSTEPAGLTVVNETEDTESTTAYISGGENGLNYYESNQILTSAGRISERSILEQVRDK